MKLRKALFVVLAVVLICAISITGTLAYLQASTQTAVVNTFVAAGGGSLFNTDETTGQPKGGVVLNESKAVLNTTTGIYTLDTTAKVYENSYTVLPGTVVPKDPAITVTEKNSVPAYLFVEVVDSTNGAIGWVIDDAWTATNVTGPHGGKVYHLAAPITDDVAQPVLKNNQVTVMDGELNLTGATITFYGYLAQSVVNGSDAPADVFTACFK